MAMRGEDFGATLTEGDDGLWSSSMAASVREPSDWQSLYEQAEAHAEQERARADAAEARAEELIVAEPLPLGAMLPLAGDRTVADAVAVRHDQEGVVSSLYYSNSNMSDVSDDAMLCHFEPRNLR